MRSQGSHILYLYIYIYEVIYWREYNVVQDFGKQSDWYLVKLKTSIPRD